MINKSIETGEPYTNEYTIVWPGGEHRFILSRGVVTKDHNTGKLRLIGTVIDITERKKYEMQVGKLTSFLLESQALSHTGSFDYDYVTNKFFWTPELYRIYGIEEEREMSTESHLIYVHVDDRKQVKNALRVLSSCPGTLELEYRIIKETGEERVVSAKVKSYFTEDKKPVRLTGILHDITERKKAEEELMRLNEELEIRVKERTEELKEAVDDLTKVNTDLDTFVYTASHDLKAPISNIDGLISALKNKLSDFAKNKESVRHILQLINESIEKFRDTLKDLGTIAKTKAESKVQEISKFSETLETIEMDMRENMRLSQAVINSDFSQVDEIRISHKNLRSILYNLISNAIKYRHPDRSPQIRVETSQVGNEFILLEVEDNGLGIKEEDKGRLFSMYQRLHHHVEGTGVGMAIVARIIDSNGGKIEVDSKVGKGTVFKVYFKIR